VAGMLMARAAEREREMSIRAALGAGRGRVVQQMVAETLVLFAVAGAVGLLFAYGGVALLPRIGPPDLPQLGDTVIDWRVLGFATSTSLVTGLAFGLLPALTASRVHLVDVLKQGGRHLAGGGRGYRIRRVLSAVQVALAIALLASAGLLLRSFLQVQGLDLGFRSNRLLTLSISLPRVRYPEPSQAGAFFDQLTTRLAAQPGIDAVGGITDLFLGPFPNSSDFTIEGRGETHPGPLTRDAVTPGFFQTMGIPLLKGRFFDARDRAGAQPVAIVNATTARRYWPNADPIGQRFVYGSPRDNNPWLTIVGVVADTRRAGLERDPITESYRPLAQTPSRGLTIVASTTGDPLALAPSVRAAVLAIDPAQPVANVSTLDARLAVQMARRRFQMTLLTAFAATALALAAVGLYGVIAQLVTCRRAEFGLRLALGAAPGDVMRIVLRDAAILVGSGTVGGLVMAAFAGRSLRSLLYQIDALDPLTLTMAPAVLAMTALVACVLPVRRAMRVDPATTLRD
jgi:putative ABC transport system permease protein